MNKGTYRRLPDSAFEPLCITAWLQCGVISDAMLPLDGVLYSIAMREKYGDRTATYSGVPHPNAVPGVQLPLKRINGHQPMWFYAASFAQWSEPVARGSEFWNCRFDFQHADLVGPDSKWGAVQESSGRYKAYHMPVFYRHAIFARWYVVGHRPSLAELLRFATHLGKKTDQGWGAVLRWDVQPWSEDWSVAGPEGKLMRAVPAELGYKGPRMLYGFRPSYWQRNNQTMCTMPAENQTEFELEPLRARRSSGVQD